MLYFLGYPREAVKRSDTKLVSPNCGCHDARKAGERSRMRCGVSRLQSSCQQIHRHLDELTQEAVQAERNAAVKQMGCPVPPYSSFLFLLQFFLFFLCWRFFSCSFSCRFVPEHVTLVSFLLLACWLAGWLGLALLCLPGWMPGWLAWFALSLSLFFFLLGPFTSRLSDATAC